eukprot:gene56496-75443_t
MLRGKYPYLGYFVCDNLFPANQGPAIIAMLSSSGGLPSRHASECCRSCRHSTGLVPRTERVWVTGKAAPRQEMAAKSTSRQEDGMAEGDTRKSDPAADPKHLYAGRTAATDITGDTAALAAALGLGVRVARARIETCATLMGNAEAALGSRQEALAINAILDAEPLLFEAQTILNATTMLRRIVREAEI